MAEYDELGQNPRGCIAAATGLIFLIFISPFAAVVKAWRRWRRGSDGRYSIESSAITGSSERKLRRIDFTIDLPEPLDLEFNRRLTDAVIRVAENLRRPDDVYHLVHRQGDDPEPILVSVGPQLQEFGGRFHLVHTQQRFAGRTLLWLTTDRGKRLAEVVDPMTCNPEARGEVEGLLECPDARWTMATSWARVGPSHVTRIILVLDADHAERVVGILKSIRD